MGIQIIAHRGLWSKLNEQNTYEAFNKSLTNKFGIETDIRDFCGELVISHDIPKDNVFFLKDFFYLYLKLKSTEILALNIKSDGLQKQLKIILEEFNILNYFVFDMSMPDLINYKKYFISFYTRLSEYEKEPIFISESNGIWIDCFANDFSDYEKLKSLILENKSLCFVSPELHGRDYIDFWKKLKFNYNNKNVFLCTDHPFEARIFFNEND